MASRHCLQAAFSIDLGQQCCALGICPLPPSLDARHHFDLGHANPPSGPPKGDSDAVKIKAIGY